MYEPPSMTIWGFLDEDLPHEMRQPAEAACTPSVTPPPRAVEQAQGMAKETPDSTPHDRCTRSFLTL